MAGRSFVELLYEDAPREAFEEQVLDAQRHGASDDTVDRLRSDLRLALRVREQMARQRQREAELSALYETANDLTQLRDVDAVLAAIVRRARQLLGADIAYLSLNDDGANESFIRVTDGSVTASFPSLRLPLGTGLLGLVAQTGTPYFTDDYFVDRRFIHLDHVDTAVAEEGIRAILGVPLRLGHTVIGALLAGNRSVRPFPPAEVALLGSLAAHAAIALENARLFEETEQAIRELDAASATVRAHSEAVELAANAHDRLADVLLHGGGVDDVAAVLGDVLGGAVDVRDPDGHSLAGLAERQTSVDDDLAGAVAEAFRTGRTAGASRRHWVAVAVAGNDHLGTVVLSGVDELSEADRRILERGALSTALLLLFQRSVAEAEDRVRGELLADLISDPARDPGTMRERARRHNIDLESDLVVLVVRADGVERHRAAAAAARLAAGHRGLGGQHDTDVVLALPGREPAPLASTTRDRLSCLLGGCTVTVGAAGPVRGPDGIANAYQQARQCVTTLCALGRQGDATDAAGLGFARFLLGEGGAAELEQFLVAAIGPVLEYDAERRTDLTLTLEAWFAVGGRPAAAAERLHIHPNTVAQRLDRVGSLLGTDWKSPERALDIQLAIRLWRLRRTADRS